MNSKPHRSSTDIDTDRLQKFIQQRKTQPASADQLRLDAGTGELEIADPPRDYPDPFDSLPSFNAPSTPPLRRPVTTPLTQAAATDRGNRESAASQQELTQLKTIVSVVAVLVGMLLILEVVKPIAGLLLPSKHEYMLLDQEGVQTEIKDEYHVDGWELVAPVIGGGMIYKRAR